MTLAAHALIDLTAVKHNLARVRQLAPNANIMAVIKADAYGHGLLRIAPALNDIQAVAVARVSEGIRLRNSGFNKKIVILEGFVEVDELTVLCHYDLDIVVHSASQVTALEQYQGSSCLSIWLKLDTGMNRLGVKPAEFSSLYQRLLHCSSVTQPISLMTHFSSADDSEQHTTDQQLKVFKQTVNNYVGDKSVANSAAILAYPKSIMEWVRPGIMLYGVSPFPDQCAKHLNLKPVMSLHSRLIAVKHIKKGDAVGYSGTWKATKNTQLGVVAIGYGDGYPRYAQTGTPVLINNHKAPLVGRVSMDMITIDLGDTVAKAGDLVTLWGKGLPVEDIAKHSNTIAYTLLCGVTQRVNITTL